MSTNAKKTTERPAGLLTWTAIGVVVVVIAVLVVIKVTKHTGPTAGDSVTSSAMVSELTTIPASVYDTVGVTSPAAGVSAPVVTKGQTLLESTSAVTGKKVPRVIYVGAEYCPYCAAERWSVITALSRFGTWSGLSNTESATGDVYGGTQTFSFVNAKYSSPYIAFDGVEMYSNQVDPATNYYYKLQNLTGVDKTTFATYDTPTYIPGMSANDKYAFPFMSIGNKYLLSGAQFSPALLHGVTRDNIASGLSTASSPFTAAILSAANYLTASICQTTGNMPADVCTSPAVKTAVHKGL